MVDAENDKQFSDKEPKVIYQNVFTSWREADEEAMQLRNIKPFETLMEGHCF